MLEVKDMLKVTNEPNLILGYLIGFQDVGHNKVPRRQTVPRLRQRRSRKDNRSLSPRFHSEKLSKSSQHLHLKRIQGHRACETCPSAGATLDQSAQDEKRRGEIDLIDLVNIVKLLIAVVKVFVGNYQKRYLYLETS